MIDLALRDLRWIWRMLLHMWRVAAWVVGTTWDGAVAIVHVVRVACRLPRTFKEALPCPRGHVSPVFGVYRCSCGALHEGWAFDRCRVCGHSAGWTPCLVCGLPIKNPLPE